MSPQAGADPRARHLRENLARVHERIDQACAQARRDPGTITLVVVTKFFPAADVRHLVDLGVGDVAENRHQEAQAKADDCADLGERAPRWHFVGGLQSNKAAAVARYADVVHSVDRRKLLAPLARGAQERERPLDVLLQVSLDDEPGGGGGRAGAAPADVPALVEAVGDHEPLRLRGLMAVAPLGADPEPAFDRLAALHADLRRDHPDATWLSAGMSGDLEAAVIRGATHLRVGSAVLGERPPVA